MSIKRILESGSNLDDRFVADHQELAKIATHLREMGYRISMTQGVYDLLHLGHLKYLEEAKACGDLLIVAIDSDRLARERKGPTRPIVPQDERLKILACLRFVDILTITDGRERDPVDLVQVVKPDVLVVSETTTDISPERMDFFHLHAGEVKKLKAQAVVTSTSRIRQIVADGAIGHLRQVQGIVSDIIAGLEGKES